MKKLIILISFFLYSCNYIIVDKNELETEVNEFVQIQQEESYFEGQKDALNNDVRIKKIHDSCYIWTKSPWNNHKKPIFNPCKILN